MYYDRYIMDNMNQHTKQKSKAPISIKRIKKIFYLSSELVEATEDILEEQGKYSDEFLSGLKKSLEEARQGKVTKISSLKDLR